MIFELAQDFHDAVVAMPREHPKHRMFGLLEEAIRRDIHFIDRHPTTLFQCMWNTCWWYDSPETAKHYETPLVQHGPVKAFLYNVIGGLLRRAGRLYFKVSRRHQEPSSRRLFVFLERWRDLKQQTCPDFFWIRSLRPPLVHLGSAQVAVLRGHQDRVTAVQVFPDARHILSSAHDGTVRIWDVATGEQLRCFRCSDDMIEGVAVSPDGLRVACATFKGTLQAWEADTGAELFCIPCPNGYRRQYNGIAYSPDGAHIAVVSGGSHDPDFAPYNEAERFDAATGQYVDSVFSGQEGFRRESYLECVTYSPNGTLLGIGLSDTVCVVEPDTRVERLRIHGPEGSVSALTFSPDGYSIAAVGFYDATVRVWDTETGSEVLSLQGHSGNVCAVAYSPGGTHIATGAGGKSQPEYHPDDTVRIWDARDGTQLACLHGHEGSVESVAYSPDGHWIVSGGEDTTIRVWRTGTSLQLQLLNDHTDWLESVEYSPDGTRILTAAWDATARVWDSRIGKELHRLCGHRGIVKAKYSPDGRRVLTWGHDEVLRLWDAESGRELCQLRGHEGLIWSAAFSPDSCRVVSGAEDRTARIWEAGTGKQIRCLEIHEDGVERVEGVAFSPDGTSILTASSDRIGIISELHLWDARSGDVLFSRRGPHDVVYGQSFSRDGRRIIVRLFNRELVLDATTGDLLEDRASSNADDTGRSTGAYRLQSSEVESVIGRIADGKPVGWFPADLDLVAGHADAIAWAGTVGDLPGGLHLYIITLSGGESL